MDRYVLANAAILPKVLSTLHTGIIIFDASKTAMPVIYSNYAICDMLMAKPLELLDKTFEEALAYMCPDPYMQDAIKEMALHQGDGFLELENRNVANPIWYNLEMSTVQDQENDIDLLMCSFENRTEWKMRDEQLLQSQRLEGLGQLAGGVAHDFNNLMSIIDGYARFAKKESESNEAAIAYMDKISSAVKRGAALTQQLLAFGRKNVVVETITDLGSLLKEQKSLLEPLVDDSIKMNINIEEHVSVECAPESLTQILINLIVNARDAMPMGGELTIEVLCKDPPANLLVGKIANPLGYGCLRITDTGHGMPEKVRQRIFDPFFTTKDQGKGTGLGLSMAYGLMQQMKGFITVDSIVGRGTTFHLYFPLSAKQPVRKILNIEEDGLENLALDGYTALVAEDEPDLLDIVGSMLEEMGMNVIKAYNGNDALVKQEDYDGDIDFLVTDVVMPELNGVHLSELFETVRPKTKTIFMSGYPAGNDNVNRIEMPAGAYLVPKPIAYDKLSYILKQMSCPDFENSLERIAGDFTEDTDHA